MHNGRVNGVTYCDNSGKNAFFHINEVSFCMLIKCLLHINKHQSRTMKTINLPKLARSLLTLIGSWKIYHVFNIKLRSPFSMLFLSQTQGTNIVKQIASKNSSQIERYTSVDGWRSGTNPTQQDSHHYRSCVPVYPCCVFLFKARLRGKGKSAPWLHYSTSQSKTAFLPDVGYWRRVVLLSWCSPWASRSYCDDEGRGKRLQHSVVEAWPDMGKLSNGIATQVGPWTSLYPRVVKG